MTPAALERHQVWFYLVAIAVGLVTGTVLPDVGHVFDALLWPVISVLLFVTFVQIPMTSIATAFRDIRFLAATLLGNFAVLPLLVWGLVQFLPGGPDQQAIQLGLLLVLLVPCTDWFITFTQLAKGATARATAVTPVNLVVQILLLPAYLWLMADADVGTVFALGDVWPALVVVLVPLGIAIVSDLWFRRSATTEKTRDALGWGPVPLLSLVVFMIAAAHVGSVRDSLGVFPLVITAAVVFIAVALVLARLIASTSGLPAAQGRTLAFSFTTRNSFVVLPFALSLPSGWELVSIVIVMQSLVELLGMVFCIWFVPKYLFPDDTAAPPQR
ncbi:MAG: arsenic resistance protein [Mycobacteriaceae bacterium]|uniref:arsenic resistance protein n=1 Tax=Corynebacterium sp. TaxID=1720 RepID=UPI003F9D260D